MALPVMPKSVILFERLGYFTALFGSVASMAANWPLLVHFFTLYPVLYSLGIVASVAIQIFWVWLIARKRQGWARWLSVVLIAISVLLSIFTARAAYQLNPSAEIVKLAIYLLWIIEFSFLFTKEAKAWFRFSPDSAMDSEPLTPTEA